MKKTRQSAVTGTVLLGAGCALLGLLLRDTGPRAESWSPDQKKAPAACRYADTSIDKRCTTDADCVMVEEVQDCCGTTLHIGLSVAGKVAFDKKAQKDLGCQPVSCVVRWMRAEDCDESSNGKITVGCEKAKADAPGLCMTHVAKKKRH